jgi:hypothetical protein
MPKDPSDNKPQDSGNDGILRVKDTPTVRRLFEKAVARGYAESYDTYRACRAAKMVEPKPP